MYHPEAYPERINIRSHVEEIGEGDVLLANKYLHVCEGVVAVRMHRPPCKISGVLLPDAFSEKTRSDTGLVIASGDEDVSPGEKVAFKAYRGIMVDTLPCGYFSLNENYDSVVDRVVFFGKLRHWSYDIVVTMSKDLKPTGANLIIKMDAPRQGTLVVPDSSKERVYTGVVLSAGPYSDISQGQRVLFSPADTYVFDFDNDRNLRVIHTDDVYAVLEE